MELLLILAAAAGLIAVSAGRTDRPVRQRVTVERRPDRRR